MRNRGVGVWGVGWEGREVLNTTQQGAREEGGGGEGVGMSDHHSITFLLHFYFRHWKRKQKKKSAKGKRKGYRESTNSYKEKN